MSALEKKIAMQREGLTLLEKLLREIVQNGLGTMNAAQTRFYEEQILKFGDWYLLGVQNTFRAFLNGFKTEAPNKEEAVSKLIDLYNLHVRGKENLLKKQENPLYIDIKSNIEEALGTVFQKDELKGQGFFAEQVLLVQLVFHSFDEDASLQFVAESFRRTNRPDAQLPSVPGFKAYCGGGFLFPGCVR